MIVFTDNHYVIIQDTDGSYYLGFRSAHYKCDWKEKRYKRLGNAKIALRQKIGDSIGDPRLK